MASRRFHRGWLLPAALALCTGCASMADESHAHADQKTIAQDGLVLAVAVAPAALVPGDTLTITLTVTNPGEAPVARRFSSGCLYGFGLWDAAGALVAPPPMMCTMNAPLVIYAPGESLVRVFTWVWDGAEPPAGDYLVRAGLGPRGEQVSTPGAPVALR